MLYVGYWLWLWDLQGTRLVTRATPSFSSYPPSLPVAQFKPRLPGTNRGEPPHLGVVDRLSHFCIIFYWGIVGSQKPPTAAALCRPEPMRYAVVR